MKKKKKCNIDIPRIGSRRGKKAPIRVSYCLKNVDEEFTITATPEAWIALKKKCFGSPDTYHYITKGLFNDLWPFIQAAYTEAQGWKPKEGQQIFRNALYLQAAIINDLIREKYRKANKQKYDFEIWGETFKKFKSVWKEDALFLGLAMIDEKNNYEDEKASSLERRFYNQYIDKGRNLLKDDKKNIKTKLNILLAFLVQKKRNNLIGYKKNRRNFQQVYDMTTAIDAVISGRDEHHFPNYPDVKIYLRLALQAFPFLS